MSALADTAARARVLVIGSLNVDLILHADSEPGDEGATLVRKVTTEVGGHAGNCASALAALGLSVALSAAVGVDADGDLLLADLRDRGIDVTGVRRFAAEPTGRVVIPVFGDRHYMLLCRGANDLLGAEDVLALVAGEFDAVLLFDPSVEALYATVDAIGRLDAPPLLAWTPGGVYAGDPLAGDIVPHCDALFLNRAEYRLLAATPAVATQVVVTLGAEGSLLRHHGTEWQVPVQPVPVVDPTGAGDAFAAAYLLALLAGLEPTERLEAANRSGALAVGAVGARARLASVDDLTEVSPL
ncbi:carbohydrate kinase family protein [Kutzneria buriramensis]|uniref:Ribokinase n=1 Tax=Kutzneria buriramensis TaxID=1045776 RepID=A0A3E0G5Z3_9PSEU|nr:PfkB family carbohydrate kinase [Kutzneria buriramensis]REH18143.1 ribokinase [Kutzneria buriramensis]